MATNNTSLLAPDTAATLILAGAAQQSPAGIVSRTVIQTPELRVTLFSFAAGQELTPHTSTRRALVQILSGECDFFFNDRWQCLTAGTLLHMPPNHLHAVRAAHGAFSMLLTLTTPADPKSAA